MLSTCYAIQAELQAVLHAWSLGVKKLILETGLYGESRFVIQGSELQFASF